MIKSSPTLLILTFVTALMGFMGLAGSLQELFRVLFFVFLVAYFFTIRIKTPVD
jgi:uncharacterized membrane protein YtjA (UPF0391 family)